MPDQFDMLSLTIDIGTDCPIELSDNKSFCCFFVDPLSSKIEPDIGRRIIHETIHLWQAIHSEYLGLLISEEYESFLTYMENKKILPKAKILRDYQKINKKAGFSNEHLLESWARFWEIQIQSPRHLLIQEGIDLDSLHPAALEMLDPESLFFRTPWLGIDIAMTSGSSCGTYGKPYRYLHDYINKFSSLESYSDDFFAPNSANASYVCCILFPTLLYKSFQTVDPVTYFVEAIEYLCEKQVPAILQPCATSGAVEICWFNNFDRFMEHLREFEASTDYIDGKRALRSPRDIYAKLLGDTGDFINNGIELRFSDVFEHNKEKVVFEYEALEALKKYGNEIAYIYFGFDIFRLAHCLLTPPNLIKFNDKELSIGPTVIANQKFYEENIDKISCLRYYSKEFNQEVKSFRYARKAVELGLSIDSFDMSERN